MLIVLPELFQTSPPPNAALLPDSVLLVRVVVPALLSIPPPKVVVVLPTNVLLATVNVPRLKMPPAMPAAVFDENVLPEIVADDP
jgi:hypothetical protein